MTLAELELELSLVSELAAKGDINPVDAAVLIIELQRSIINQLHNELNQRKIA